MYNGRSNQRRMSTKSMTNVFTLLTAMAVTQNPSRNSFCRSSTGINSCWFGSNPNGNLFKRNNHNKTNNPGRGSGITALGALQPGIKVFTGTGSKKDVDGGARRMLTESLRWASALQRVSMQPLKQTQK